MTAITLQIEPIAAEKLREEARLRGQTLEAYLQQLVEESARASKVKAAPLAALCSEAESSQQWSTAWRVWAAGHSPLPREADDSRESIYAGRDE